MTSFLMSPSISFRSSPGARRGHSIHQESNCCCAYTVSLCYLCCDEVTQLIIEISINRRMATATIQQIIFAPGDFFNKTTLVEGNIVLVDINLGRVDISDNGAKLIVEIGQIQGDIELIQLGTRVLLTGIIKKHQRRTLLEAKQVVIVDEEVEGNDIINDSTD